MRIITFLTDFGLQDSYTAQMKGAVMCLCPQANLIDITHLIPPGDIAQGAFVLSSAIESFPDGAIHVGVVDPGVGTTRRRIIIEATVSSGTKRAYFVGPDNGLFSLVAPRERRISSVEITQLNLLPPIDYLSTFDGRDVFAPAAALLATGRKIEEFGEAIENLSELSIPAATESEDGSIRGEIIYIDHFGNAISNLSRELMPTAYCVLLLKNPERSISSESNYQEIPHGGASALINSAGLLEIACNNSSAAESLGIKRGDLILVTKQ